jgi:hypothetical protein
MITLVDHEQATYSEHVNSRGAMQRQYDYFGKQTPRQFGPEAFLVDYGPDRSTTAHFHSVDQFQIFFGATGARYQRHQIPAVELHYADAFVTYGPFSAGAERMRFFTLRPCQGQFKGEMPSERHKLRYQGRRGIHVDLEAHLATRPANGESSAVELIGGEPDGLSARLVAVGTAAVAPLARPTPSSGTYVCVLRGHAVVGDRRVGPLALGWIPAGDDHAVSLSTGAEAAAVLLLTYPYPPTPQARADAAPG